MRKAYRTARNSLPQYRQRKHARQVASQLKRSHAYKRAKTIASYLSSDGEIDTGLIHQQIWRAGKTLYLPTTTAQNTLKFSPCKRSTALETGQWGIKQPRYSKLRARHLVPDLLLVPLVAFDSKGNRLGRGGGFYDRYLARLNRRSNRRRGVCGVEVVGIAHDVQKHHALPTQRWDAPIDAIVTERGVYTAK